VSVLTLTVNVAPVEDVSTANPEAETVRDPPGLIVVGESVTPRAVRANAVSETPTLAPEVELSVAVKTIVALHALQEVAFNVGIVVA
jgi:hypothetical protein